MAWVPFDPMQPPTPTTEDPLLAIYLARTQGANPNRPETYGESHFAQGMSGLNEGIGALLGAPVDLSAAVYNLGVAGLNALFPPEQSPQDQITGRRPEPRFKPVVDPIGGSQMFNRLMGSVGAITPETDDPGKQMLRRTTQDVGASFVPGMRTMSAAARPMAALAKELTLAAGTGFGAAAMDQLAPDNPWAELAGQILGGLSTGAAIKAGKKLVTPFPVQDPARLGAMEMLRREGVDLSAGQQTGHKGLQNIEGELAGAEVAKLTEQQVEQFTRATLKRARIDANRATEEALQAGYQGIVADFGDIGSRNDIRLTDGQLGNELADTYKTYFRDTAESNRLPAVETFIVEAAMAIKRSDGIDVIDGRTYASLRSRVGQTARETTDPVQKSILLRIQRTLDDAMERSVSKGDIDAFRQARATDRDFTIIDQAAKTNGLISPAALQEAAIAAQGDLGKLADSGAGLMTPLPGAGMAPGTRELLKTAPIVLGTSIGSSMGGTAGATVGTLVGLGAPYAAGRAIMSNAGRRYLANQMLNGPPSGSNGIGPISAMLAGQTSQIEPSRDPLAELGELIAIKPGPIEIVVRGGNKGPP